MANVFRSDNQAVAFNLTVAEECWAVFLHRVWRTSAVAGLSTPPLLSWCYWESIRDSRTDQLPTIKLWTIHRGVLL
jgi:hypothetical protein